MKPVRDHFLNGRIGVLQHSSGYRFSMDSILLANAVQPQAKAVVLDLGTGCGIIPLILVDKHPGIRVYGVEIQPELAELARQNARDNGMADRITIYHRDMLSLMKKDFKKGVDIIVCNPPYRKSGSGRINPNDQRAVARHEIRVTLDEIVTTAKRLLNLKGRFMTIYPAQRTVDILTALHLRGIEPKRLTMIHAYRDAEANLMIVEGINGGGSGITVNPPLVLYRKTGDYTAEVEKMFR